MKIVDCQCKDCAHKVLDVFDNEIPKVCPWCGGQGTMARCLHTGRYATTEINGVPLDLGDGTVLRTQADRAAYTKKLNHLHGRNDLVLEPRDHYRDRVRAADAAHMADRAMRSNGNEEGRRKLNNRRWKSM